MELGKDKRRDQRVPLVLRVDYPGGPGLRDATENLSAGGLFLRTDRDLAPGERVPVQVSFPGLLDPLELEVEVVWRRAASDASPAGVAVKIPLDRVDDRHKLAGLAELARTAHGEPRGGFRVLVVEENPHALEMYDYALRRLRGPDGAADVSLEVAANGQEALARLDERPRIDLVIADLSPPATDGLALVERVRGHPALARTPIVVMSGGGPEARDRALDLGVDVVLQKPVQFADVIRTVRTLLRIRR
jgi:uncharacterized protein (TIGR02266 family)